MLKNVLTTLMILLLIVASVQAQSKKKKKPSFFNGKNNNISFSTAYFRQDNTVGEPNVNAWGIVVAHPTTNYLATKINFDRKLIEYRKIVLGIDLSYGLYKSVDAHNLSKLDIVYSHDQISNLTVYLGYTNTKNSFIFFKPGIGILGTFKSYDPIIPIMAGYKFMFKNQLTLRGELGVNYLIKSISTLVTVLKPSFGAGVAIGYQFGK